ncbi:MAG: hypothetical protein A3F90_16685 [Deltaproteobacteria bacterium RIFCSPLOWO2_12_FULL_60_19]|nr:MAG: hypothetical protein A3F90_16685 [Deltaproteobacteria bacterium RIFCSPLOWO2_12_FULL_60_19]
MNPYGQRLNAKQKQRTVNRLSALAALFLWLLPSVVEPAEGQAKIQGAVFISPSGKLEGDLVMRGAGVEVMILRGDGSFEANLAALRQNRLPTINKQLGVVNKAQDDLLRAGRGSKAETDRKSVVLRQERAKLAELKETYAKEANELIAKHTFAKTKTDSEGKFTFAGIVPGRYLVYAHFEIAGMEVHYYWLLPVEARTEKEIEVSLDKLNSTSAFYY